MSRKNSRKKQSAANKQAKLAAKKQAKMFALQKNITIFAMLILLVVGLVSTTFSAFIPQQSSQNGSLVAEIQSNTVKQREKEDLADTKANVDVATTGADRTFVAGERFYLKNFAVSGWNNTNWIVSNGTAWVHFWNKSNSSVGSLDLEFKLLSGTHGAVDAIYYVEIPPEHAGKTYDYFIITRNQTGNDIWNCWNQTGDMQMPSHRSNMVYGMTSGGTSRSYDWYAETPNSVSATVTNAVSGTGTSSNPYIVRPGASYTVKLTASKPNPGNEGYGYNINSSSTSSRTTSTSNTYSKSYTASSTEGTSYTYTGYAWAYDEHGTNATKYFSSSYKTSSTIYVKVEEEKFSYTITAGTGGTVSPTSGTASPTTGVSITATPSTGYTFANWSGLTNATLSSTTSATTTLKPTANNATVKAIFRPNTPSVLTLTASNVASGTSGTGTKANPYIVFKNGGFTLTPTSTVPTGSVAHYSTASASGYSANNKTFSPSVANIAADVDNPLSYTVYAKAYANSIYSTNPKSATAYYLVFNHLNGANTGFTISSDSITDAESISFSNPYVNDDTGAAFTATELSHITQTYQVSTDNSVFTDISGSTWTPNATGTYNFRVKTTNNTTGETVYSTSQTVTVTQSTVYYPITVTKAQGSQDGTVTLKTDGTTITDNQILSNSPLSVSITRPNPNSNYYFEYLKVNGTNVLTNLNGNITDELVIENVKSAVSIEYKINVKPTVEVEKPTNALAITFNYYKDGVSTDVSTAGTYYVDYNSTIKYTIAPMNGYYVSSFTGVSLASGSSWSSTQSIGTKANVTANIDLVTAGITQNNTVTVNVDETLQTQEGASLTVDGVKYDFGQAAPLNYGVATTLVVTPPEGYYAQVTKTSGVDISPSISTDGKATFIVTLRGTNAEYSVEFVANPKIYIEQPQYGSIYINDDSGRYYFNGESVGYGTVLTVNVKKDNQSNSVTNVKINGSSIGTTDVSTFSIVADSTATADISLINGYDNFGGDLAYGYRRIFFTDSRRWGSDVTAHVSNTKDDFDFTKDNNFGMTPYYTNDYNQNVYYCDIPYDKKYVVFFDFSTSTNYTSTATIDNTCNAFFANTGSTPYPIGTWTQYYSDYVATDRVDTIQQANTSKNVPVTFKYTCDFGDKILSAEVVDGNACMFDFDSGDLIITPTDNTMEFSLVKVTSSITQTVKYYLIKVENFELKEFSGIRKIYSTTIDNTINIFTALCGGDQNYSVDVFVSDSNGTDTFGDHPIKSLSTRNGDFEFDSTLGAYVNEFIKTYYAGEISGVKFYKIKAEDGSGKKAEKTLRTLFGTNTHTGERCFYVKNNTTVDISKYDLRVCFFDSNNDEIWATTQKVGESDYYRITIPTGYEAKFNLYLAKKNRFTNSIEDMGDTEYCAYAVINAPIPEADSPEIVYSVYAINSEGISGEFVEFD